MFACIAANLSSNDSTWRLTVERTQTNVHMCVAFAAKDFIIRATLFVTSVRIPASGRMFVTFAKEPSRNPARWRHISKSTSRFGWIFWITRSMRMILLHWRRYKIRVYEININAMFRLRWDCGNKIVDVHIILVIIRLTVSILSALLWSCYLYN